MRRNSKNRGVVAMLLCEGYTKKQEVFGGQLLSEDDHSHWAPPYWNVTKETCSLGRTEVWIYLQTLSIKSYVIFIKKENHIFYQIIPASLTSTLYLRSMCLRAMDLASLMLVASDLIISQSIHQSVYLSTNNRYLNIPIFQSANA